MTDSRDPIELFESWFAEAKAGEPNDPEAMALATADADGRPSLRMVLMKSFGPEGFTFYTHRGSHKGQDIAQNANVALLFHWKSLRRQVRIEGVAVPVDGAEADAYFATRPRDSQLGAWASVQSQPLPSRAVFEERFEEAKRKFEGMAVPRPEGWSGYRVTPERMEFWIGREHRLHDRRLFELNADGWTEGLLYP